MPFSDEERSRVLRMVKEQPRTVQEIALAVDRSWVTAEKYLNEMKEKTGLINLRTFREGTQGALKVVYSTSNELSFDDEIRTSLAQQIIHARRKEDFDFLDVFQFVKDAEKKSYITRHVDNRSRVVEYIHQHTAEKSAYVFSGNLSFLSSPHNGKTMVEVMEEELERGAQLRILTRIGVPTIKNMEKIAHLFIKYPAQLEIRHRFQPLRGVVIDGKFARFITTESAASYREGELPDDMRVYYEITSKEWIEWLEKVFWQMWRSSIPFEQRIKEIQKIAN